MSKDFPVLVARILGIAATNNDILITWNTGIGRTNALQATDGAPGGSYTNTPARYYRVRFVP